MGDEDGEIYGIEHEVVYRKSFKHGAIEAVKSVTDNTLVFRFSGMTFDRDEMDEFVKALKTVAQKAGYAIL